jgi:hypothetical protein
LGLLTLGSGLGAGLGLSQGFVTASGGPSAVVAQKACPLSKEAKELAGSCQSFVAQFVGGASISPRSLRCVSKSLVRLDLTSKAIFERDVTTIISKCENRNGVQAVGTFQHFFENTGGPIPPGYASCDSASHQNRLIRLGSAAFKRATSESGESCTWQEPQG